MWYIWSSRQDKWEKDSSLKFCWWNWRKLPWGVIFPQLWLVRWTALSWGQPVFKVASGSTSSISVCQAGTGEAAEQQTNGRKRDGGDEIFVPGKWKRLSKIQCAQICTGLSNTSEQKMYTYNIEIRLPQASHCLLTWESQGCAELLPGLSSSLAVLEDMSLKSSMSRRRSSPAAIASCPKTPAGQ